MMYQIEENLLKLAYTKGISSQGKWALANWMMQYPYKEIGFEDIIKIGKITKHRELFRKSWQEIHANWGKIQSKQSFITCFDPKYPPQLLHLTYPPINLDFKATKKLADLLCDLKNKGFTIVIAEHRFYYLKELIDQVLFVKNRTVKTTTIQLLKTENNNALRKFDIFNSSIEVPYIEKVSADVLKVEEITYENILKDINFDVKVGDVIGLVGKNGVGKTTLLRILMKIIRPTKGKIIENKKNLSSPFLVMQEMDYQFFTESVRSELALGNEIVSKDQQEKILKKMELYKMKDQLPFDLSGGEKQRLLVSIASLSKTNLFLFDEPTSGLDYINMERIADLIKDLKEKGAVVIATHDPEFLYKTCNRIIYLKNGGIKKDIKLRVEDSTLIEQIFNDITK